MRTLLHHDGGLAPDQPSDQETAEAQKQPSPVDETCNICQKLEAFILSSAPSMTIEIGTVKDVWQESSCANHVGVLDCCYGDKHKGLLPVQVKTWLFENMEAQLVLSHATDGCFQFIAERPEPDVFWAHHSTPMLPLRLPGSGRENTSSSAVEANIVHGDWVDKDLFCQWRSNCNALHGSLCDPDVATHLRSCRPAWLIDVLQERIVSGDSAKSYATLSYVWGKKAQFTMSKSNHSVLLEPGGLAADVVCIPNTIRQAMEVSSLIGERYLWVDSICIVQDDWAHKQAEISCMSGIFANSSITIVIKDGDAYTGTRGIQGITKAKPRYFPQDQHSLGPRAKLVLMPRHKPTGDVSHWDSRGWTFQEGLFAARQIVLDHGTVRWECRRSLWREDCCLRADAGNFLERSRSDWGGLDMEGLFQSKLPDINALRRCISAYNTRSFTFDADVLPAFAGFERAVGPSYAGGFVHGMPLAFFDIAMLWAPDHHGMERRIAPDSAGFNTIPSWSWMGWQGGVDTHLWTIAYNNVLAPCTSRWEALIKKSVSWTFHHKLGGPGTAVAAEFSRAEKAYTDLDALPCPAQWTRHEFDPEPVAGEDAPGRITCSPLGFHTWPRWVYRFSEEPTEEFWYPTPLPPAPPPSDDGIPAWLYNAPRWISTTTRRAWLRVGDRIFTAYANPLTHELVDAKGQCIGSLAMPTLGYHEDAPEGALLELVEVAEVEQRGVALADTGLPPFNVEREDGARWEYYYVFWIQRQNTAAASKEGVGRVEKRAWDVLELDTIELVLG